MQIYQVGGAVRDRLLKRDFQDTDYVVVGSTESEMLSLGYKKVGKHFPVFLHPQTNEEYALARKEIKIGKGHCGFKFIFTPDITLQEDSLRRDFTCNAIYYNPETKEYIDYHHGQDDIKDKILRHISTHFSEDPLRVLRMCRFSAQLNFKIAPETMELCRNMTARGDLATLSPDRIWQEFEKTLHCANFSQFIKVARECGALAKIFPEIETMWQVPERLDYHPEGNTGSHVLLALDKEKSTDSILNFAILMHDIGKIKTDKAYWPSHHDHEKLGVSVLKEMCKRGHIPKQYEKFAEFCIKHHMISHKNVKEVYNELTEIAIHLADSYTAKDVDRFIAMMHADLCGRGGTTAPDMENFLQINQVLQKLYQTAKNIKINQDKDFPQKLQKLQTHQITPKDFFQYRVDTIQKYAKVSV